MKQRVALVTGGTGVIGPTLTERLLANGYEVRVLARKHPPSGLLSDRVQLLIGDITNGVLIQDAVRDVDVVFHLAAKLHIHQPDSGLSDEYHRVNVDGTRIVTQACQNAHVERLIFFSSIAIYGSTRTGEVVDECSPARGDSVYARSKVAAEKIVLSAYRSDGAPLGVVLRLAATYGPRMQGNYRQLVEWLHRGWFIPVGPGANRRTLVHYQDVAAGAILAAESPLAEGLVFNVTDGGIHTFHEIVAAIQSALGRRPRNWYVPEAQARVAARALDRMIRILGRRSELDSKLSKLLEDVAVNGDRMRRTLGFRPAYDLYTGWTETVEAIFPELNSVIPSHEP